MSALTFTGKYIKFSYVDDAFTFYPLFPYYEGDDSHTLRNCLQVYEECGRLDFVIKRLPDHESTYQNEKFIASLETINGKKNSSKKNSSKYAYDKFVRRNDDDHLLYHRDKFSLTDSHWHIKFRFILNAEKISILLSIFEANDLISAEEKQDFLKKLETRYIDNRSLLDHYLRTEKIELHKNTIIQFLKKCTDNDVLADLHDYLLIEKFDYLREYQKEMRYQGTDRTRRVTETSEGWAMIEKTISQQMVINIREQCTDFSPKLGKTSAKRLARQYQFFGISRKAKHGDQAKNKLYQALRREDKDTVDNHLSKRYLLCG